ncbi:MAG: hypothetical protein Q4B15_03315 [Lachnospiraceae bacterium]|nr:hypothetical protein [Lachnospiraceae bacterium]
MRVFYVTASDASDEPKLLLGREGEANATQIKINVSNLIATFGEGTATCYNLRPQRQFKTTEVKYEVETTREGNNIIWIPDATAMNHAGFGRFELVWTVDDTIAIPYIWTTEINPQPKGMRRLAPEADSTLDKYITDIIQSKIDEIYEAKDLAANLAATINAALAHLQSTEISAALSSYPVGSVYISVLATEPSEALGGGTWERLKDMFLLAAGDIYEAGTTGGEATHTLTIDEMPKHYHVSRIRWENRKISAGTAPIAHVGGTPVSANDIYGGNMSVDAPLTTNNSGSIANTGGDAAHNNMPPYIVVYVWRRTA